MKLWGFGKRDENKNQVNAAESSQTLVTKSDYECLWIPISVTFMQLLPRVDLNLCVNERGEIALIGLPDLYVVVAIGKAKCEHPNAKSSAVFIQRIHQGKDESYVSPIAYTDEELRDIYDVVNTGTGNSTQPFDWKGLLQRISKVNWSNIVPQVESSNTAYLTNSAHCQKVSRLKITDNFSPKEPDDFNTIAEYPTKVPVFIYLLANDNLRMSRNDLERELGLRLQFSLENRRATRDNLRILTGADVISDYDPFVGVLARVEAELRINSETRQTDRITLSNLLLNPKMSEFVTEPNHAWKMTPKGQEETKKILPAASGSTISNFGEVNIVHIAFHVGQSQGKSLKDTVVSPSIFIFKDKMGIHTTPTHLFRIHTDSFIRVKVHPEQIMNLDELPVQQIPELEWIPIEEKLSAAWWQTDKIAKKVLWLVTRYLASHLVGNPQKVIYSVTPIGDKAIQVTPLFDNLEDGSPYAFVVIRDYQVALKNRNLTDNSVAFKTAVVGIPVFQSANYKVGDDGAMTSTKLMLKKDYCITNDGVRAFGPVLEFIGPVYSTILSGDFERPTVYETTR